MLASWLVLVQSAFAQPTLSLPLDLDGDAVVDIAEILDDDSVRLRYGDSARDAVILTGIMPNEAFGWRLLELPDVNGDSLPDLLVSAPGMRDASGEVVGGFYAFAGTDGALIWSSHGYAGMRTGMGVEVIDDQDKDNVPDLLAIAVSGCPRVFQFGVVVSSTSGKILAVRASNYK